MQNEFSLKTSVEQAAVIAADNSEIDVNVGGGLHQATAALWAYLLGIQRCASIRGNLMEIGVFKGWSLFIPGRYCRDDEALYLLDISRENLYHSQRFVLERKLVLTSQLKLLEGDTLADNAIRSALAESRAFRWAHIDGEHSFAAVINDLALVSSAMDPSGIICIDDVDYSAAPCVNDALMAWLGQRKDWRLLLRGFNKAYVVSTRSTIPWQRYINFLPEVMERYFGLKIMLASQTHTCESGYFAFFRRPQPAFKYMVVNRHIDTLENFEGLDPRAVLLD